MPKKHPKKFSINLTTRDMQIQSTLTFNLISVKITTIDKTNTPHIAEDTERSMFFFKHYENHCGEPLGRWN